MRKLSKKIISTIITIAMVMAVIPVTVSAAPVYGLYASDRKIYSCDSTGGNIGSEIINSTVTNLFVAGDVTGISEEAFWNCASLETVDLSKAAKLASIEVAAFKSCTSLTSITIPENVTAIRTEAFMGCSNLQTVDFSGATNLKTIFGSVFSGCTNLETVDLSNATKLESIFSGAFYNCTSLTSMTIPASVNAIGGNAFSDCTSLSKVDFLGNNAPVIGTSAFNNAGLAVTYPSGATGYDARAFVSRFPSGTTFTPVVTAPPTPPTPPAPPLSGGYAPYYGGEPVADVLVTLNVNGGGIVSRVNIWLKVSLFLWLKPRLKKDTYSADGILTRH